MTQKKSSKEAPSGMAGFHFARLVSPPGSSAKAGRNASINRKLKAMKVELNWGKPADSKG